MKPYQLSKLGNKRDIANYNNNYITYYNQLDPRHWLISLKFKKKENIKNKKDLDNLKFLSKNNNYYKTLADYEYFKNFHKIEKNNF